MNNSESEYEKVIIERAKQQGFQYIESDKMYKLRKGNLLETIIIDHLKEFLIRSGNLDNEMISIVIRQLRDLRGQELIQANQLFQKYLSEGIKVFDKIKEKYITVRLFDEKNNILAITNQYVMVSAHPDYEKQKPDMVLYMNGLPISVIELKSPTLESENTLEKAYRQIDNYKLYLPNLFVYNVFNIISDGNITKVGSLTASLSRFQNWRGSDFNSPESYLYKDLLKEEVFIDVMKNYSFYKEANPAIKIIAGYHQYYGVKGMIESVLNAMETDKKGGLFWHTQGSGKSFSMMFFVKNFSQMKPGTTFIVITDRNDLDNQLFSTFKSSSKFIGQKIEQIDSIEELKIQLKNRQQDGVYFSTVQKFTEDVGQLINRENVVVISDEAHRSHNNINGSYEVDLDNMTYKKKYGNAKYLRDAFPQATFIGFTGTPIESDDKSTTSIFGDIVTEYKMNNAERDGVIVPINYESRKAQLQFDLTKLDELDLADQELNDELNAKSSLPGEIKKKINKQIKELRNFISDRDRIAGIVDDLIPHYESRQGLVKGKAMIVAINRHVALTYYQEILKKRPEWKNKMKLVVTNSNKQSDPSELIELAGSSQYRKQLASEFKNENSEFKIAIVVDMWLTGFDVPSLDTLYLDKPIKMHNLMQTIARTNRVYTNKKEGIVKETGLVVDYIGIWTKLGDALAFYSGNKNKNAIIALHDLPQLKDDYLKQLKLIWNNYGLKNLNVDYVKAANDGPYMFNTVDAITSTIYEKKAQNLFVEASKVVSKWVKTVISILKPDEVMQFQLLISARLRLIKIAMDDIDFIGHRNKMLGKLEEAIRYEKTVVIDKVNNSSINLNDILRYVDTIAKDNKALSAMEKKSAIHVLIEEVAKTNMIRAGKLSDELNQLLNKYDSSHITLDELINGLIFIKDEIAIALKDGEEDGLTQQERAFLDIISKPIEQSDYDKEKIKNILDELLVIINNDKLVNKQWAFNSTLVRKTKAHLKKLLRNYNYPPKQREKAQADIIEQIMKTLANR